MPGPESLGSSNQYSPLGSDANCVCLVCAGGDEVAQQAIMRRLLLLLLLLRKEETLQEHSRTKEVRRVKERKREERRERGRVCVCVCVWLHPWQQTAACPALCHAQQESGTAHCSAASSMGLARVRISAPTAAALPHCTSLLHLLLAVSTVCLPVSPTFVLQTPRTASFGRQLQLLGINSATRIAIILTIR